MKLHRLIKLLTISTLAGLCLLPSVGLQAQTTMSTDDRLIYIRSLPSGDDSVVVLSDQSRRTVTILQAQKHCYAVSLLGNYLALSTTAADELVIRSIETGSEIVRYPWADEWNPCDFVFFSERIDDHNPDTMLFIDDKVNPGSGFYFDVLTGAVSLTLASAPETVAEPPGHLSGD